MALAETQYGKFFYFEPDAIGRRIAAGEFFDVHIKLFIDALKPGQVFVDVGANIGFLSIYAATRGLVVHAFEPALDVFMLLSRNLKLNFPEGAEVNVYMEALYDSNTFLKINPRWTDYVTYSSGEIDWEHSPNSGGLSLVPTTDGNDNAYVRASTLDEMQIARVDLLKVDTQGSDLRVLKGAENTIEACRPTIIFEYEPDPGTGKNASGDSIEDFFEFLSKYEYVVQCIHRGMTASDYVAEYRP